MTRAERRYAREQMRRLEFRVGCEYWDNRYARLGRMAIGAFWRRDHDIKRHYVEAAIRFTSMQAES